MMTIREGMEGGFNNFLKDLRNNHDKRTQQLVSLYQFDDRYETVYENKPIAEVPNYVLEPRGNTALLDAIGKTINTVGQRLAQLAEDERPGLVTVVIVTDGYENVSREFTLADVNALIKRQQETYNWMFVFLGANQDAIASAARLGIPQQRAMTYAGGAGGQAAYASVGRMVTNTSGLIYGGSSAADAVAVADFTDEDRSAAVKPDEVDEGE